MVGHRSVTLKSMPGRTLLPTALEERSPTHEQLHRGTRSQQVANVKVAYIQPAGVGGYLSFLGSLEWVNLNSLPSLTPGCCS